MLAFLATPISRWVGSIVGGAMLIIALVAGFRWWLHEHDKTILSGYVLQSELDASKAATAKLQRDILLGEQIREQADKASDQLDIEAQKRRDADEKAIAGNKGGGSIVTRDDLDSVERVRKSQ